MGKEFHQKMSKWSVQQTKNGAYSKKYWILVLPWDSQESLV